MEAYVKYNLFHKEQKRAFKNDIFRIESLYYNPDGDYFVCPMGQHMERVGVCHGKTDSGYRTESVVYRARRCEGCPLRWGCYKKRSGNREIEVNHRLMEYKRKARERLTSEKGLEHRSKRPIEPEAVFGQLKYDGGFKRFHYRGNKPVRAEFATLAIAHNIKKMATLLRSPKGGWQYPSGGLSTPGQGQGDGARRRQVVADHAGNGGRGRSVASW